MYFAAVNRKNPTNGRSGAGFFQDWSDHLTRFDIKPKYPGSSVSEAAVAEKLTKHWQFFKSSEP